MTTPELPNDCSAHQVLAVLDSLLVLHRLIWNHYEHELVEHSLQQQRAPQPTEHEPCSDDDDIPW